MKVVNTFLALELQDLIKGTHYTLIITVIICPAHLTGYWWWDWKENCLKPRNSSTVLCGSEDWGSQRLSKLAQSRKGQSLGRCCHSLSSIVHILVGSLFPHISSHQTKFLTHWLPPCPGHQLSCHPRWALREHLLSSRLRPRDIFNSNSAPPQTVPHRVLLCLGTSRNYCCSP